MSLLARSCGLLCALGVTLGVMGASKTNAQDVVRIESASAEAGELVTLPLRIRDRANTPLGSDGDPFRTIRGLSVTVGYSPASAVQSIEFVRAGLTSRLQPRFEAQTSGVSRQSWLVSFNEAIPFSGGFQTVAFVRLRLAADAAPGTIDLRLVPETTALANGSGTIIESVSNDFLQLTDGSVTVTGGCTTANTLCLLGDRFAVEVVWTDFEGASGSGNAVRLTSDAGYFWFFNDANVELVFKVLDGRAINGHFWIFYGALSNVEFEVTVTDRVTGATRVYRNPLGQFASRGDIEAFPGGAAALRTPEPAFPFGENTVPGASLEIVPRSSDPKGVARLQSSPAKQGTCVADGNRLCLLDGRFRLEMSWEDFEGNNGVGNAVQLTDDGGYFWFFDRDNVELVVKTLDGRPINGQFWVFYGALSNVEFTLEVTDTVTGETRKYFNPLGIFASVGDTVAF